MEKLKISNTKDEVANIIREEIISGRFSSQDNVTQEMLANKFGLSRMPIREAMNTLIQEGFLVKHNNRKISPVTITDATLNSYVKILTTLELELIGIIHDNRWSNALNESLSQLSQAPNSYKQPLQFIECITHCCQDVYSANLLSNLAKGLLGFAVNQTNYDYEQVNRSLNHLIELLTTSPQESKRFFNELHAINTTIVMSIRSGVKP